ncbi:MAG: 16S rRNA processing protein RimM [Actinobacteria bacterium]|nr:16S rRNA processing protein RimM [Actinomycetota bacterium]
MIKEAPTSEAIEVLAVARIIKPHGIKGAVVVEVLSDFPERFSPGNELLLKVDDRNFEALLIETSFFQKGKAVLKLFGIDDREGVEKVRNEFLFIREMEANRLGKSEYWIHDLYGLSVVSEQGEEIGEVMDVFSGGAQDLLNITGKGGKEIQIPFVEAFIKEVDLESKKITVTLIRGMID